MRLKSTGKHEQILRYRKGSRYVCFACRYMYLLTHHHVCPNCRARGMVLNLDEFKRMVNHSGEYPTHFDHKQMHKQSRHRTNKRGRKDVSKLAEQLGIDLEKALK